MRRAFAQTDRKPQDVDFLELHATGMSYFFISYTKRLICLFSGTASGDPTEANWVGTEFKRDDELALGSVKGNVGYVHKPLARYQLMLDIGFVADAKTIQPSGDHGLPRVALQGLRHFRDRAHPTQRQLCHPEPRDPLG